MSVIERVSDQAIEAAKQVSLLALAERHSELRRVGAGEFAGPCPRCGGSDRFHVSERGGWWFCRQCHEKRGDSIELVRWLSPGVNFAAAVAQLSGQQPATSSPPVRRRPEQRQPEQQSATWRQAAERMVAEAADRLWAPAGEPARAYLESRALEPATWAAYGFGYEPEPNGKQQPAIVMPWRAGGHLVAVRFRFLAPADPKTKIVSAKGSQFAGRLFGGQALPEFVGMPLAEGQQAAEAQRWLLITEGEINAASCWQAAGESRLDTLSMGSESAHLSEAAVKIAQRYGRVLVWADKGGIAQSLMQALPGAYGVRSPGGRDANDLLRAGLLGGFLAAVRVDAAKAPGELERLLWALWDAAGLPAGLDTGSAKVLLSLAGRLGKVLQLAEPEPGRWVVAERCGNAD